MKSVTNPATLVTMVTSARKPVGVIIPEWMLNVIIEMDTVTVNLATPAYSAMKPALLVLLDSSAQANVFVKIIHLVIRHSVIVLVQKGSKEFIARKLCLK